MPFGDDIDLFALLAAQVADAVALTDAEFRVVSWSAGAERMLGWSAAEAVGQPLYALVRPDLAPDEVARLRADAAAAPATDVVSRRLNKAGVELLLESHVTRVSDANGDVRGFLIVTRDVTHVRSLEAAVHESESRYQSVVESVSEGVVVHDPSGAIVACNAAAERILGLTRAQILGRSSLDPRWRAVREDGSPLPGEEHPAMVTFRTHEPTKGFVMGVHTPDGRLRWLSINAEQVAGPRLEAPRPVVATFSDVTEARAQALTLRDSVRRLNLVMGATSDGYWDHDLAANRTYLSPHAMRILELRGPLDQASELLAEQLHPGDRAGLTAQVHAHLLDTLDRLDLEVRCRRANGGWRWLHIRGRVVEHDANGRPIRIAGALSDVDERHHLLEKLAEALASNVALVQRLEAALSKVLSGFLPVCAWCKSVDDGLGEWLPLGTYVERHSDALVTHCMCPRCYEREVGEPPRLE